MCELIFSGAVCEEKSFRVPDRQTGLRGLAALNPNRKWNFVHINVTKEELQKTRYVPGSCTDQVVVVLEAFLCCLSYLHQE